MTYLQAARGQGDALLVGVTSDAGVRALKGPGRPVNNERDRAGVLAGLESVDAVIVFSEPDARAFLQAARPDIYAKGGDYTLDTINQDERRLLEHSASGSSFCRAFPECPPAPCCKRATRRRRRKGLLFRLRRRGNGANAV